MPDKLRELFEEFKDVLGAKLLDVLLPPLLFLIGNQFWSLGVGAVLAAIAGLGLLLIRWRRGESLLYAVSGAVGAGIAIGFALLFKQAGGFFIPDLASGAVFVLLSAVSLLLRKPITAWTSFVTRRWPLGWYWHAQVRPAYTETSILWLVFFGLRLWYQWQVFQFAEPASGAWIQALSGWPAMIALLVLTYVYGTWRLRRLTGPSVEEFKSGAEPPWQGQQRGF